MGNCCSADVPGEQIESGENIGSKLVRHHFVDDITSVFTFEKELGKGAYGAVYLVSEKKTGAKRALKAVKLEKTLDKVALRNEINILKCLRHPNIVSIYASYEDKKQMYMSMHLCTGGDLFTAQRKAGREFSETEIAYIIKSVLSAIQYLHQQNICHRDLKLENLLFDSEAKDASLKLCDFGFCRYYEKGEYMRQLLGTADYLAPEVLEREYTQACDIWAIGVITYELVAGHAPFTAKTRDQIIQNILAYRLSFDNPKWNKVSVACKSFVKNLLKVNPRERPTAADALKHKWIAEHTSVESILDSPGRHRTFIKSLKSYTRSNQLRKMALLSTALALEDKMDKVKDLMKTFQALDTTKSGTIGKDGFIAAMVKAGVTEKEASLMFKEIDQCTDGHIDILEFTAAMLSPFELDDQTLRSAFDLLTHGSEHISIETVKALAGPKYEDQEVAAMIAAADHDNDGKIGFEEFRQLMRSPPMSTGRRTPGHRHLGQWLVSPISSATPAGRKDFEELYTEVCLKEKLPTAELLGVLDIRVISKPNGDAKEADDAQNTSIEKNLKDADSANVEKIRVDAADLPSGHATNGSMQPLPEVATIPSQPSMSPVTAEDGVNSEDVVSEHAVYVAVKDPS